LVGVVLVSGERCREGARARGASFGGGGRLWALPAARSAAAVYPGWYRCLSFCLSSTSKRGCLWEPAREELVFALFEDKIHAAS